MGLSAIYMGTPEFAVPALRQLHQHAEITAVFCQPDKPVGRSRKLQPPPVKVAAQALGLTVHQPRRIRAKKWCSLIEELAPDLIVVAAFGQILPQRILDVPRIDCINIHASLLPRWRGASPIHHAIAAGDAETGVGIMRMELELDAGPVYRERAIPVAGLGRLALEKQLSELGANLLIECLPDLERLTPEPQDASAVTFAPIIEKHFGYCDPLKQNATQIWRLVRAYENWPSVVFSFRDQPLKVHLSQPLSDQKSEVKPGSLLRLSKKVLALVCAEGSVLRLLEVQPAGKKPIAAAAFMNGVRLAEDERLEAMPLPSS